MKKKQRRRMSESTLEAMMVKKMPRMLKMKMRMERKRKMKMVKKTMRTKKTKKRTKTMRMMKTKTKTKMIDADQRADVTRKRKKKRGSIFFDDNAEESDDNDEEIAYETSRGSKGKKKKGRTGRFEDSHIEEDDEEEEEIASEAYDTGLSLEPSYQSKKKSMGDWTDQSAADYVSDLKKRMKSRQSREEEREFANPSLVRLHQSEHFPTARDKKLFMVKIKAYGSEETRLILYLMQLAYAQSLGASGVTSITSNGTDSGYIYIEADRLDSVTQLIRKADNVNNLFKPLVLDLEEMPSVFEAAERKPIKINIFSYVRIRLKKVYYNDIAQVLKVNQATREVTVRLIPRIDYSTASGAESGGKRVQITYKNRPLARIANEDDLHARFGHKLRHVPGQDRTFRVDKDIYQNGFLIKNYKIHQLIVNGVIPNYEEIQLFLNSKLPDEDESSMRLNQPLTASFKQGDRVVALAGEFKGLKGELLRITNSEAAVIIKFPQGPKEVIFQPSQLGKSFEVNDHVMITQGQYEGVTGYVMEVKDMTATIITDIGQTEIKAFSRDLVISKEVRAGISRLGQYGIFDFVVLTSQEAGVIVGVERDTARVLTITGAVISANLTQIQAKKSTRQFKTIDSRGNAVKNEDVVVVSQGPHRGKKGNVLHVYQSYIFLQSKGVQDNNGVFVIGSKNCLSTQAVTPLDAASNMIPMSPRSLAGVAGAAGSAFMRNSRSVTGADDRRGQGSGDTSMFDRSGKHRDIGKVVIVTKGAWKGYRGVLKDNTVSHCRIELQTGSRTVTVPIADIRSPDNKLNTSSYSSMSRFPSTPMRDGGITPGPGYDSTWAPNTPGHYGASESDYMRDTDSSSAGVSFDFSQTADTIRAPVTPGYTPSTRNVSTPGAVYSNPTPQSIQVVQTPGSAMYTPSTPATVQPPRTPAPYTPNVSDSATETSSQAITINCFKHGMHVRVRGHNTIYILKEIDSDGLCKLEDRSDATDTLEMYWGDLEHVAPTSSDQPVYVFAGEYQGTHSEVLTMENTFVIVKIANDFLPISISNVCVMEPNFDPDA
eukprot:TRINITY_DN1510_c0_g1_i1.p1 TRINITY_DN1510_c0_g1~~TRINITY_DN1510_c0_g1_i1.p1  ORF type:complete len:1052 (-),score=183.98 TRINITY_DN1510_c0_g1_i1:405-3560(-)